MIFSLCDWFDAQFRWVKGGLKTLPYIPNSIFLGAVHFELPLLG